MILGLVSYVHLKSSRCLQQSVRALRGSFFNVIGNWMDDPGYIPWGVQLTQWSVVITHASLFYDHCMLRNLCILCCAFLVQPNFCY